MRWWHVGRGTLDRVIDPLRVAELASCDYAPWWPRPVYRVAGPVDDGFVAELQQVFPAGRIVYLPLGRSLPKIVDAKGAGTELPPLPRFRALAAQPRNGDDSNVSPKPPLRLRELFAASPGIPLAT